MKSKILLPIRVKILLTLLFVVTAVVGTITYAMAGRFHQDKKTYIHDLTSLVAMGASEETRSVLSSYEDRLRVLGRTMTAETVSRAQRTELLQGYFGEVPDLLGIVLYEAGRQTASVFDNAALERAGLTGEAVLEDLRKAPPVAGDVPTDSRTVENRTLTDALPMFSLAVPLERDPGVNGPRIVGLVRLEVLQRLSQRSPVFEVFLLDSRGNLLAHPDRSRLARNAGVHLPVGADDLSLGAAVTREFDESGTAMIGGYATTRFAGVVAGVQIPQAAAYLASREIRAELTTVALLLLAAALVIGMFGARHITKPVERLLSATRRIGRGEFDVKLDVSASDEIGALSRSFNDMAGELHAREEALAEAQTQLIQSEKMAAFGQLGAGVAHEVKNPLAGILGCAQLSLRSTEEGSRLHRNLQLIEKETQRCREIVDNLLRFARQEKAVLEATDLGPVIRDTVAIVNHQLELNNVHLEVKGDPDLPTILGNANQLQQVLLNLLVNAQQAMGEEGGNIRVETGRDEAGNVRIVVADDGPGISEENAAHIFEPFFTTKPGGKGTGLGLSVSYGIVKDHGGEIRLRSTPGEGATFTLTFPPGGHDVAPVPGSRPGEPEPSPAAPGSPRKSASGTPAV